MFVGSRPIEAFGGTLSRIAEHTYIATADPLTGEKRVFQGSAHGGLTQAHLFGTLRADADVLTDVASGALYYADSGSCDSIVGSFRKTRGLINEGHNGYKFLSVNSNSVISTLLTGAGLPSERPSSRVFGWGASLQLGSPTTLPWYVPPFIAPIGFGGLF